MTGKTRNYKHLNEKKRQKIFLKITIKLKAKDLDPKAVSQE